LPRWIITAPPTSNRVSEFQRFVNSFFGLKLDLKIYNKILDILIPYLYNVTAISIYKFWFFGYANITINSNNDRPVRSSMNLNNLFLLHISVVGWRLYHQRTTRWEISLADLCRMSQQMYFLYSMGYRGQHCSIHNCADE